MAGLLDKLIFETGNPGRIMIVRNKGDKQSITRGVNQQKRNSTKAKSAASKIANTGGSTEVLVKISSWSKGRATPRNHADYISRNGKLTLETSTNERLLGKGAVQGFMSDWLADSGNNSKTNGQARVTMNMVLSIYDRGREKELSEAVRRFSRENFGKNHEYAFVYHGDSGNDHCHLMVKVNGFDGRRLRVNKNTLQQYRTSFAEHLMSQGVEATATTRSLRNQTRRAEKQSIRHINDPSPENGRPARMARVTEQQITQAIQELKEAPGAEEGKPWTQAIKDRAVSVEAEWLAAAQELDNEAKEGNDDQRDEARAGRPHGRAGEHDGLNPIIRARGNTEAGERKSDIRKGGQQRAGEGHSDQPFQDRPSDPRGQGGKRDGAALYRIARSTVLYQSGYSRSGRLKTPVNAASLRAMPDGELVHGRSAAEVLLRQDAHDGLGRSNVRSDFIVRCPNAPQREPARALEDMEGVHAERARLAQAQAQSAKLADEIRGFVAREFAGGPKPTQSTLRKAWIVQNQPELLRPTASMPAVLGVSHGAKLDVNTPERSTPER